LRSAADSGVSGWSGRVSGSSGEGINQADPVRVEAMPGRRPSLS
jgi:hypothetical protein